MSVRPNSSFDSLFSSASSKPILVTGWFAFSTARVSVPVYITSATTVPEARTVFAQRVWSSESDSLREADDEGAEGELGTELLIEDPSCACPCSSCTTKLAANS